MLNYINDKIKEEVKQISVFCEKHDIEKAFYDLWSPKEYEDEEVIIDEETTMQICLPRGDECNEFIIIDLLDIINEVESASLIGGYKYISPKRILIRVDSLERERIRALDDEIQGAFISQINLNGQIIEFRLSSGFTNFGLLVVVEGDYDENYPPVLYEDLFIEIYSNNKINEDIVDDLMHAYIFELSSSMNVEVFASPRQNYFDYELEEEEKNLRLRPLACGKGVKDILSIYNSATKIEDPDILILIYTKVIEYVSQTVVRRELLDTILNKFSSPRILSPDASFVIELERSFEDLRNLKRDKEAIQLTIETCCDLLELVGHTPKYLKNLYKFNLESTKDEKKNAYSELSNAISDTRNMIAHAKTNYKLKGSECPKGELDELAYCLKIVANQVIRWFLRQHEDNRVI